MDSIPIRRRDAEATRERILDCAKKVFTEKGYDTAGTREIAACADVNVALVTRYFGSKKKLFEEALLPEFDISNLLELDDLQFSRAIANLFANKGPKENFDPMLALIRSAGSTEVGDLVRAAMSEQLIKPLAKKFGGQHADQRAALLMAQLAGFDLFRRIIGVEEVAHEYDQTNEKLLVSMTARLISEP